MSHAWAESEMEKAEGQKAGRSPRVSVSLDSKEMDALEAIASRLDRSLSQVAARAIRFYLSETSRGSRNALEFERGGKA